MDNLSRRKAVFLDRDGVINIDRKYVHRIEDFEFIAGVPQALRCLQQMGWALVVVTNQSGIARGHYSEHQYERLTEHIRAELRQAGVNLDAVLHCPHLPDATVPAFRQICDCRKPAPGMLLRAAADLDLDLSVSALVGNRLADLQAGRRAGVGRCILVLGCETPDPKMLEEADAVYPSLFEWMESLAPTGTMI